MTFTMTINGKHYDITMSARVEDEKGNWVKVNDDELNALVPDSAIDGFLDACRDDEYWNY